MSDILNKPETTLRAALDHVPQGVAVFDANLRLIVSNARYQELLALPPFMVEPGIALSEMTRFGAERGDYGPGDPAGHSERRLADLTGRQSTVTKRRNAKGQ